MFVRLARVPTVRFLCPNVGESQQVASGYESMVRSAVGPDFRDDFIPGSFLDWHPLVDRPSALGHPRPVGATPNLPSPAAELDISPTRNVLVTVPVHNEARFLYGSIHKLVKKLDSAQLRYRICIAEDGSTDETPQVMRRLQNEFPSIVARSDPQRLGRGLALRRMWSELDADVYLFVDADLAAGPSAVLSVLAELERGADVVTGSRYCPGAVVRRPALRRVTSLAYNWLVRRMFNEPLRDHQCGLKAFTREAISRLLDLSKEDSWAWDTEVLVLAQLAGLNVREVPVEWTEYRSAWTPVPRLVSDIYLHGAALLRLKGRIMSGLPLPGHREPGGIRARTTAPAAFE